MYLLYVLFTAFLVGMCGLITQSLAFISKEIYYYIYCRIFYMDVASDDAIQFDIYHTAFIEYGFEDFIKIGLLYMWEQGFDKYSYIYI